MLNYEDQETILGTLSYTLITAELNDLELRSVLKHRDPMRLLWDGLFNGNSTYSFRRSLKSQ